MAKYLSNWLRIDFLKISFLVILFWWPVKLWALPVVSSISLNGSSLATFNPQAGESLSFILNVNEPVKFSTIAICAVEVVDCTRTSAVKYFTQTSKYDTVVEKVWDGKKGGSNSDYVPTGNYRLVVTLAGEGGEGDKAEIDLNNNIITVSNLINTNGDQANNINGGNNGNSTTTIDSDSLATTTANLTFGPNDYSPYSSYGYISIYNPATKLAIGGGRARLALVGVPIDFRVEANELAQVANYRFSFGDGTGGEGRRITHSYSFPGTYEVVITGRIGDDEVVASTKVKVIEPTVDLIKFNPFNHEVVLRNYGVVVMNVGGFKLVGTGFNQQLAADTMIQPGQTLSIYVGGQLVTSSILRLESPGSVEVSRIEGSTGLLGVSKSSSKVDELDLAKEEKILAQVWEAQLTAVRESKKLMIVDSTTTPVRHAELTQVTTTAQVVARDKNFAPPRLEPKKLVTAAGLLNASSTVIYQGSTPRSWWRQMVKLIGGIFYS